MKLYIKSKKLKKVLLILTLVIFIAVLGCSFWSEQIDESFDFMFKFFDDKLLLIKDLHLIYFSLAILFLPLFFLPVSPIFLLASYRVAGDSYLVVLLYCYLGITANVIFSYFVSKFFANRLRKCLDSRNIHVPSISQSHHLEITLLMRIIPGNPLGLQNYFLGVANVSFFKYVIASLPILYIDIAIYVYLGESIFSEDVSNVLLAISLLFVISIVARILERNHAHKLKGISK